ncbi:MAG: TetR/AcrR family transcriptional regulator [Acidimicrobiales bacterium]|jgi:AcrR family transcriptional regulator
MRRAVSAADKASRRQDILAAAKEVFAEKGYHATTIADIARAAGLSYGSIYWYYESKETLFHELMSAEAAALRQHIDTAVLATPRAADPAAPFRAAVRATIEFYDADRALVKLLFRDAFALGQSFEEHLSQIQGSFVDDTERLVVTLQRQGVMMPGPSRVIAFAITSLIGQLAHRRLMTDDGLSAETLSDFLVDLVLHGLLVPSGIPA